MKNTKNPHQSYYERKQARAEETLRALAKVTVVLVPLLLVVEVVRQLWF